MKSVLRLLLLSLATFALLLFPPIAELRSESKANLGFAISFPATSSSEALDGRLLLLISKDHSK
jgi:hypothetical protein